MRVHNKSVQTFEQYNREFSLTHSKISFPIASVRPSSCLSLSNLSINSVKEGTYKLLLKVQQQLKILKGFSRKTWDIYLLTGKRPKQFPS